MLLTTNGTVTLLLSEGHLTSQLTDGKLRLLTTNGTVTLLLTDPRSPNLLMNRWEADAAHY